MENTLSRMVLFAENECVSVRQFELSIGLTPGLLKKNIKVGSSLGSQYIENTLNVYPQLNANWLLTGEGEMLKKTRSENTEINGGKYLINEQISHAKEEPPDIDYGEIRLLQKKIIQLLEEKEVLKEEITLLREQLNKEKENKKQA